MKTYYVAAGDTLSEIAAKFGVDLQKIIAVNSIKDPDKIYIGQAITIPEKDNFSYDSIGQALRVALNDIQKLPSVQALNELLRR